MDRMEAARSGQTRYNSGKPCARGHRSDRYTSTGGCIACLGEARTTVKQVKSRMPPSDVLQVAASEHGLHIAVCWAASPEDAAALQEAANAMLTMKGLRVPESLLHVAPEHKRPLDIPDLLRNHLLANPDNAMHIETIPLHLQTGIQQIVEQLAHARGARPVPLKVLSENERRETIDVTIQVHKDDFAALQAGMSRLRNASK